jgi:hypothetical protein
VSALALVRRLLTARHAARPINDGWKVGTALVSSASSLVPLGPRAKMKYARAMANRICTASWARLVLGLWRAGVTCFVISRAMQLVGEIE